MADSLQQLQDDQSLLVMYVADELDGPIRFEFEQRLLREAELGAERDRLAEAYGAFAAGMAHLDAATPMDADVSAAVRRASVAIRTWRARPVLRITPAAEKRSALGLRIWALPSAVAAIVLVVMGVSLYNKSGSTKLAQLPRPNPPSVQKLPSTPTILPPPESPQAEDDAGIVAMITDDFTVPSFDRETLPDDHDASREDVTHDEAVSVHDDGHYKPVFDIPLVDGAQ